MPINIYDRLQSAFGGAIVDGDEVSVDTSGLADITGTNLQQIASELERLYTLVRSIQNDRTPSGRSLVLFNNSVDVDDSNYETYINKNAIYSANTNQVVTFTLPVEDDITTYPATFEITHLGGTQRFDTGNNPTNTITIDLDSTDITQLENPAGTMLSDEKVYRGDTVVISKGAPSENWVVRKSQLNLASTILPNGIFQLQSQTVDLSDDNIEGLANVDIDLGYAYAVATGGGALGVAISAGDVIIAKVDDPSLVGGNTNDDWLILREANNFPISLQEIRFLNQINEQDTPVDNRVSDGTDATEAYVWLSPYILDHIPFEVPSSDPDNPQSGETESYIGGSTNQNSDYDFQISSNHFQDLLYVGIKTSYLDRSEIHTRDIYVQLFDLDNNKIFEYNLDDDFVDPPSFATDDKTYFVYSQFNLADSFTSIRYAANQRIKIIHRTQNREFTLSDHVDITSNISDLPETSLSQQVQAKLNKEHSLQHVDRVRLDAIETNETTVAVPTDNTFSFKAKYGAISHNESDYHTIQNSNGLIGAYEGASPVVIRVASNVTVTHLAHEGLANIPVTEITPSLFDNEKTYTASIPAISGSISNTIFDHPVTVVGTIANEEAVGLDDSIKIGVDNLDDPLDELVHRAVNNPYQLPDNLQSLSDNMTVTTNTRREWSAVQPAFLGHELTREFAILYDFNWYNYDGDELNEFDDITGVEVAGYSNDDFHHFDDASDSHNTAFSGRANYISNDAIRVRNVSGTSPAPIDDTFRKIMFFDYSYQNRLGENQRDTLLRLGDSSTEPILEYTDAHGLVMRVSTQDSPATTRNRNVPALVENGQWTINNGVNSAPTTRVILPDDITAGQSVPVRISLRVTESSPTGGFNPLNPFPAYTATEHVDITITNIDSDQTFSSHTFGYAGLTHESVTVGISYDHDHSVNGETRRTILLTPTLPLESGHISYDVSATFTATETFRPGTSFTDLALNSNTALHSTNRIGMIFQKYREDDTDSDPTIGVKLIINGSLVGSDANDYLINTHRRASQFDFDNIEYGGRWIALSRIQTYRYNPVSIPNANDLTVYYRNVDNWLGSFTNVAQDGVLFRINRLDLHDDDIPTDEQLTAPMRFLSNHLSLDNDGATGTWRRITPEPIESGLTRRVAFFFNEDKTVNSGNLFNDVTGIDLTGFERKTRYYPDPDSSLNTDLNGVQSYVSNGVISITNTTGDTPIPNSPNLIMGFDYSQLGGVLNQSLVRFGGAVEPLLSTNNDGELVLNIGAQNGTRRSRNYEIPLSIEDNHWNSTTDDGGNNAQTEVPLPFSSSHPTITVNANLHVSGVDTGNDSHTFTFTEDIRQNDKNFGTITFDFGGGETLAVTANYTFSNGRLVLTAVNSLTDATKVYNFTATIRTFEAWTPPDTANHPNQAYHEQVLHLGNSTLRHRNRVLFMLAPFRYEDSDSDPEMGLRIIVNNTRGGEAYYDHTFRTYRPESDFDFNNITLGTNLQGGAPTFAIGRVQLYNYDSALPPTSDDLLLLYSGIDRFLDAFTNQDPSQTRLQLNSDLELDEGRSLIIQSPNGTKYEITVSDSGTLSATVLT